jgi:UrcA family protein
MFALNNKKYRFLTGAAVAILCGFGGLPKDASAADTGREVVSLQGLDLSTPQDRAMLRHKLLVASAHVCAAVGETAYVGNDGFDDCRKEAFRNAWAKAEPMIAEARSRALAYSTGTPHRAEPGALVASAGQR